MGVSRFLTAGRDGGSASRDSRDFSQETGSGASALGGGTRVALVPARISATTCLQLKPTGQLHRPSSNCGGSPSASMKNAVVE